MNKFRTLIKKNRRLLIFTLLIIIGFYLYSTFFKEGDSVSYITEPVRRQDVQKVVNATGEVRASELVTVDAQASGKIEKLHVSIGQNVKKGRFDCRD